MKASRYAMHAVSTSNYTVSIDRLQCERTAYRRESESQKRMGVAAAATEASTWA